MSSKRQASAPNPVSFTLSFDTHQLTTRPVQSSCTVITNLSFCDQVAYAVPSNPQNFPNATALAAWYDNSTQAQYKYFQLVLAQIPCEAPPEQRYSLARNCTDCATAYKDWLCSVMIPRCEDFSNNATYLQPRDIYNTFPDNSTLDSNTLAKYTNSSAYNSSRNPLIDQWVSPGPYKEVLPCADLCYNLVQSCPASMSFGCPTPGTIGFNTSYGLRTSTDQDADPSCNYPGSAHFFSAAGRISSGLAMWLALLVGMVVHLV
jgi:calcium channel MID1